MCRVWNWIVLFRYFGYVYMIIEFKYELIIMFFEWICVVLWFKIDCILIVGMFFIMFVVIRVVEGYMCVYFFVLGMLLM